MQWDIAQHVCPGVLLTGICGACMQTWLDGRPTATTTTTHQPGVQISTHAGDDTSSVLPMLRKPQDAGFQGGSAAGDMFTAASQRHPSSAVQCSEPQNHNPLQHKVVAAIQAALS
jgi:hypothetical protein